MYPYVMSTDKFKDFLGRIVQVGTPSLVDTDFLKTLGYTSSNDKTFLGALKFIGLVEDKRGGGPTDLWKEMRANQAKAIAKGTRAGYAELFSIYANADQKDDEALHSFFTAKTDLAADTVKRVVATFRVFADIGDFSDAPAFEPEAEPARVSDPSGKKSNGTVITSTTAHPGMVINVNIQLQVPPDATGEIYEQFFKSMREHLLN